MAVVVGGLGQPERGGIVVGGLGASEPAAPGFLSFTVIVTATASASITADVIGDEPPPPPPSGGTPRFTYERVPAPAVRNDDDEVLLLLAL